MMYLMEARELLNLSLPTLFFVDFSDFCFFSLFYTYLELKSRYCSTSFCRKKDSQFDRKKELKAIKDERELFFVCYIPDIYYSLNSIIH